MDLEKREKLISKLRFDFESYVSCKTEQIDFIIKIFVDRS